MSLREILCKYDLDKDFDEAIAEIDGLIPKKRKGCHIKGCDCMEEKEFNHAIDLIRKNMGLK